MKRNILMYVILIVTGLVMLNACEKDPWVFDTSRKAGIAVYEFDDSLDMCFDQYNDTTWLGRKIMLNLIGMPVDHDRSIEFAPVDTASTLKMGEDFTIDNAVLKANETRADVWVWVRRPEKSSEQKDLHFTVRLVDNQDFAPYFKKTCYGKVTVKHVETTPKWWDEEVFGKWSEKSYKAYFKYYRLQQANNTDAWQLYFQLTYGIDMMYMQNVGVPWTGIALYYQQMLKKEVLEPMFDYYTANPHPEVEIPQWYKELK